MEHTATTGVEELTLRTWQARVLDESQYAVWDSFVSRHPSGNVFSLSRFAAIYSRHTNINFEIVAVFRDEALAGGQLIYYSWAEGRRIAIAPPFIFYSAILWGETLVTMPQELANHPVYALIEYIDENFSQKDIWLDPGYADPRPFLWKGWQVSPRFTYIRKPASVEELILEFPSEKRAYYRRPLSKYNFNREKQLPPVFTSLLNDSFGRHDKKPPLENEAINGLLSELISAGLAEVFTAAEKDSGEITSIVITLSLNNRAIHWFVTGVRGEATRFLILRLLDHFATAGFHEYDLCGANVASIGYFKRRFNSTLVPCYTVKKHD